MEMSGRRKEENRMLCLRRRRTYFKKLSLMDTVAKQPKREERKRAPKEPRRRQEKSTTAYTVKLVRGPLGTYVAPNTQNASNLVYADLKVGDVDVRTLVDSGAEASCCSEKWYEKNRHMLGRLEERETEREGKIERGK